MPHFFCAEVQGERVLLTGENAHHMERVLRMKVGEAFTVSTADKLFHYCEIETFSAEGVRGKVFSSVPGQAEPSLCVTLYQALPKGDKMELILQKAVELGVSRVVPVLTKRCVSRPDEKSMKKKLERYRKIVEAAAKQSGRNVLPEVGELLSFTELCQTVTRHQTPIVCYEGGGKRLRELVTPQAQDVALLIGSEGGFEAEEIERLQKLGVHTATLGPRILRCETAPLAALSIVMELSGNI